MAVNHESVSFKVFRPYNLSSGVDRYVHLSGRWSHLCLRNYFKIATKICQFSQYLGTELDMLFEIAKSVEIVRILGKTAILP